MNPPIRRLLGRIHLWLALVLGLPLAVVSALGVPLSYWTTTDRLACPGFYPDRQVSSSPPPSLDEIAALAAATVPGGQVQSMYLIETGAAAHVGVEKDSAILEVAIDARTGRTLGSRIQAEALVFRLYELHANLGLGATGRTIIMALAIALLVLSGTGLALWWPRRGYMIAALRPRLRPGRLARDLHIVAGLYGLAALLIAGATTVVLLTPLQSQSKQVIATKGIVTSRRDLEGLRAQLHSVRPAFKLRSISGIGAGSALAIVAEAPDGTLSSGYMSSGGELRLDVSPFASSRSIVVRMHTGAIAGPVGRAGMAIGAALPLALWLTGLWMWGRRKVGAKALRIDRSHRLGMRKRINSFWTD